MSRDPVSLSKFLSLVLRHKPDAIGLALGPEGWVGIDELIEKVPVEDLTADGGNVIRDNTVDRKAR